MPVTLDNLYLINELYMTVQRHRFAKSVPRNKKSVPRTLFCLDRARMFFPHFLGTLGQKSVLYPSVEDALRMTGKALVQIN